MKALVITDQSLVALGMRAAWQGLRAVHQVDTLHPVSAPIQF